MRVLSPFGPLRRITMFKFIVGMFMAIGSLNSAYGSELLYGKFSPIYAYLDGEPMIFKGQASAYIEFGVKDLTPVNRGIPISYYRRALSDPSKCKVKVPLSLTKGIIKSSRPAIVECQTKKGFAYKGKAPVIVSYRSRKNNRYVGLECESKECTSYKMPKGTYLLRFANDARLKHVKLKGK